METKKINLFGQEASIYTPWNTEPMYYKPIQVNIYPFQAEITLIGLEGYVMKPENLIPVHTEIARVRIKIFITSHFIEWCPEIKIEFLDRLVNDQYLDQWIINGIFEDLNKEALKRVPQK